MASLNQRVPGSSPGAPTNHLNTLGRLAPEQIGHGLQFGLQFCSRFELHHRDLGQLNIAAEVVGVEDRFDVAQTVTSKRRDLWHRGVGESEPHDG